MTNVYVVMKEDMFINDANRITESHEIYGVFNKHEDAKEAIDFAANTRVKYDANTQIVIDEPNMVAINYGTEKNVTRWIINRTALV